MWGNGTVAQRCRSRMAPYSSSAPGSSLMPALETGKRQQGVRMTSVQPWARPRVHNCPFVEPRGPCSGAEGREPQGHLAMGLAQGP